MIKYYCDKCKKEVEGRFYELPIHVHITAKSPFMGHSQIIDGKTYPVSGRMQTIQMCIKCYNEVMYPIWNNLKKDITLPDNGG